MKLREMKHTSPYVRLSKRALDTGFQGFNSVDSRFQVLDSGILELNSGFQHPGFRIPKVKCNWKKNVKCNLYGEIRILVPNPLGLIHNQETTGSWDENGGYANNELYLS